MRNCDWAGNASIGRPRSGHQPAGIDRQVDPGDGGGWGDPLLRDPERVKKDVRDDYITAAAAYGDCGVVVTGDALQDPDNLQVDLAGTTEGQRAMRLAR